VRSIIRRLFLCFLSISSLFRVSDREGAQFLRLGREARSLLVSYFSVALLKSPDLLAFLFFPLILLVSPCMPHSRDSSCVFPFDFFILPFLFRFFDVLLRACNSSFQRFFFLNLIETPNDVTIVAIFCSRFGVSLNPLAGWFPAPLWSQIFLFFDVNATVCSNSLVSRDSYVPDAPFWLRLLRDLLLGRRLWFFLLLMVSFFGRVPLSVLSSFGITRPFSWGR